MGTRLTCRFSNGSHPLRGRNSAIPGRRRAAPGVRRATSGARCHIRRYRVLGRRIKTKFVLHGVLIGVVGTLIYIAITRAQPEPWPYWVAHALKVVGGAAGGMVLAQRQTVPKYAPNAVYPNQHACPGMI